jgi:hypothetical protein
MARCPTSEQVGAAEAESIVSLSIPDESHQSNALAALQSHLALVETRRDVDVEELTAHVAAHFQLLTRRQLLPFIREMRRRFKHLPRKSLNSVRPSIAGCVSFGESCQKVLRRTPRTVRYLLQEPPEKPKGKKVPPDADANRAYVEKHASNLSEQQQKLFVQGLEKFLRRMK